MAVSNAFRAIMLGRRPIQVGVFVGRTRRGWAGAKGREHEVGDPLRCSG